MRALILIGGLLAASVLGMGSALACGHKDGECDKHECCTEGSECCSAGTCEHDKAAEKIALSPIDQAEVKLAVQTMMGLENRKAEGGLTPEAKQKIEAETSKLAVSIRQRGKVDLAKAGALPEKKSCCSGSSDCCKKKSGLLASANVYDGATKTMEGGCAKKSRQ